MRGRGERCIPGGPPVPVKARARAYFTIDLRAKARLKLEGRSAVRGFEGRKGHT